MAFPALLILRENLTDRKEDRIREDIREFYTGLEADYNRKRWAWLQKLWQTRQQQKIREPWNSKQHDLALKRQHISFTRNSGIQKYSYGANFDSSEHMQDDRVEVLYVVVRFHVFRLSVLSNCSFGIFALECVDSVQRCSCNISMYRLFLSPAAIFKIAQLFLHSCCLRQNVGRKRFYHYMYIRYLYYVVGQSCDILKIISALSSKWDSLGYV